MINLLAIYYRNIGPFEGKECSLIFDQGKFLIKAPIGSGKSFLFFDGPSYALYRTSSRNMLNIHSKEGEISLLFEESGNYFLIQRNLKLGKSKDSCSSKFFRVKYPGEDMLKDIRELAGKENILLWGMNIVEKILGRSDLFQFEEEVLKNETDTQQYIEQLLPPKPVFMSTMFLLQDAENIFEMQPAERLIVLKNVFGLLGIDEAKEQVQDKKREIGYKLKALQDQSHQDAKLRKYLGNLQQGYGQLKNYSLVKEELKAVEEFFLEIGDFIDQLSLNDFSLKGLETERFVKSQSLLQEKEKELLGIQTNKEHLQKQINEINETLLKQEGETRKTQQEISSLEKLLTSIDAGKIEILKKEKADLYAQQKEIETGLNFSIFSDFLKKEDVKSILGDKEVKTLADAVNFIQECIMKGKELNFEIEQKNLEIKNLALEQEKKEIEQKNHLEQLLEKQKNYGEQLAQAKKRLADFDGNITEQSTFSCEKIGENCPFIKVINKQHFDQLEQQKLQLQKEVVDWGQKIAAETFEEKVQALKEVKIGEPANKERVEKEITEKKKLTQILKEFLVRIGFKEWEETLEKKKLIEKHIQEKDQAIMQLETEVQKLQQYQQQKSVLENSLQNIEKQSKELNEKLEGLKGEIGKLNLQLEQAEHKELTIALKTNQEILQQIRDIEQLIQDATSTKNLVKDLQHQEKLLGNLYTILSKEILLIALDEYLPVLSDIINSFLSQVVEYQISMKITETSEKLELEAKIFDEKGEREVKSLSGGQRTILKLVRMLAISSYLQTPLLFLDETINNLDADTVGKVSEMINNFVKQRTMKFYTVTHNSEIQAMEIWDQIIEI